MLKAGVVFGHILFDFVCLFVCLLLLLLQVCQHGNTRTQQSTKDTPSKKLKRQ